MFCPLLSVLSQRERLAYGASELLQVRKKEPNFRSSSGYERHSAPLYIYICITRTCGLPGLLLLFFKKLLPPVSLVEDLRRKAIPDTALALPTLVCPAICLSLTYLSIFNSSLQMALLVF